MSGRSVSSRRRRSVVVSVLLAVVVSVGVPIPGSGSPGVDVGPGEVVSAEDAGVHQPAIDALREHYPGLFDGTGCEGGGGLCPRDPLLRWEMAVWLVRVSDGTDPSPQATSRFADVDAGSWWAPHTDRLAELRVTKGCDTGPLRFCPTRTVTRAQMASFLVRAFQLGVASPWGFADTAGGTHEASIDSLAAAGVTTGCDLGPPRFCPKDPVTRAQMATFLARALGLVGTPTQPPATSYVDVPADHPDAVGISRLREDGVFNGTGCGAGSDRFCPEEAVDRKTFAVWLVRVLDGEAAPALAAGSSGGSARFVDVPASYPESGFVERLGELGVASGCGGSASRFCPEEALSREQMAVFLDGAFDFPNVDMEGFVDVDEGSNHEDRIKRVWAARIDEGCTPAGPLYFCPDGAVSRGEAATVLAKAVDWQAANLPLKPTGSDNSVGLSVTYADALWETTVSWNRPSIDPDQVSQHIIQWRDPWGAFGADKHLVVPAESGIDNYEITLALEVAVAPYAIRIISFYDDGRRLASDEVKVESASHRLRDLIESEIIDPHQDSQLWLRDTWRFVNSPRFLLDASRYWAAGVYSGSDSSSPHKLKLVYATSLTMPVTTPDHFSRGHTVDTIIHELGHVYTETNGITKTQAPAVGVGYLYLAKLRGDYGDQAHRQDSCAAHELYADLAVLAFRGGNFNPNTGGDDVALGYWGACDFGLREATFDRVKEEVQAITQSVFIDQEIPDWFYDNYQKIDGSIDLDKLWSDIRKYLMFNGRGSSGASIVAYDLRNSFGGYCSEENIQRFFNGGPAPKDHWRDAGCDTPEPEKNDNATVTPNPDPPSYEVGYTLSQLARARARPEMCWIAVGRNVYDVTPRAGGYNYPGPGQITDLCGQDATQHFRTNNIPTPPEQFKKGRLI